MSRLLLEKYRSPETVSTDLRRRLACDGTVKIFFNQGNTRHQVRRTREGSDSALFGFYSDRRGKRNSGAKMRLFGGAGIHRNSGVIWRQILFDWKFLPKNFNLCTGVAGTGAGRLLRVKLPLLLDDDERCNHLNRPCNFYSLNLITKLQSDVNPRWRHYCNRMMSSSRSSPCSLAVYSWVPGHLFFGQFLPPGSEWCLVLDVQRKNDFCGLSELG